MRAERDSCVGGVPRNTTQVLVAGPTALGGVGDPVVVELQDVVGRCHQP